MTLCDVSLPFRAGIAVISELRDLQTLDAMALDRIVPRKELFDGEGVASANLLYCQNTAVHCFDDRGLALHGPALGVGRGNLTAAGLVRGKPKSPIGFLTKCFCRHGRSRDWGSILT